VEEIQSRHFRIQRGASIRHVQASHLGCVLRARFAKDWAEKGAAISDPVKLDTVWPRILLEALPAELGQLQALQQLTIHDCRELSALPAELGQLQALQQLTIHDCRELSALPAELGQLQALQQLTIHDCRELSALPAELGQLQALQQLRDP